MSATNVATLNEQLMRRPESLRENLARYIADHLDEIADEMQWADGSIPISNELKAELLRREEAYYKNPDEGSSWEEFRDRLLISR